MDKVFLVPFATARVLVQLSKLSTPRGRLFSK